MIVADRIDNPTPPRTRLKRLRLVLLLCAVLLLGAVSFAFGMFVSIVSGLPSLTRFAQYKEERSSVLLDNRGQEIGVLSQSSRVIVTPAQIPPIVKEAVISIEDKRFMTEGGVDLRGIARALLADVTHGSNVQGGSTIEEQFIKNALQAQSHRTIFEKLREAALAYQLSRKWSKQKILAAYLNTIYFGNGAYGIEAAAQTYFGHEVNHLDCGTTGHKLCVEELAPWEAALLAGIIQDPVAYNPVYFPANALQRRNTVLEQMYQQGYITKQVYQYSLHQALPAPKEIQAPQLQTVEGVDAGYFTGWVQQQVVEQYGAPRAYSGGLRVRTTLDLPLQRAAEQAVQSYLPDQEDPDAAMVVIENATGAVRAMVGGRSYEHEPFNLATEGERQPGSSFKAFDLATALEHGISLESVWPSHVKEFLVHGENGRERFVVHNDEGSYSGTNTLLGATAVSDNSIYAEVGLKVGTRNIARIAHRMGITTPISTNAAMTIGGLKIGVTPLDMAHAYETIAHNGQRVSGTLAAPGSPVGIEEVTDEHAALPDGSHRDANRVRLQRVLPQWVAEEETRALEAVIQYGTGTAAQLGQFAAGKTGTTSNYGDAWFVGWDSKYTAAVWVGFPNKLVPMTTEYNGSPVYGGTFPALIWHDFMATALRIEAERARSRAEHRAYHEPSTFTPSEPQGSTTGRGSKQSAPQGETHQTPQAKNSPAPSAPSNPAPSTPTPPSNAPTQPSSGGTSPDTGGASAPG